MTPLDRFMAKVKVAPPVASRTGCWIWIGAKSRGGPHGARLISSYYGHFWTGGSRSSGRVVRAHRWIYEQLIAPIPSGLDLDHIVCDNSLCVNPFHCIPTIPAENSRRNALRVNARRKRVAA